MHTNSLAAHDEITRSVRKSSLEVRCLAHIRDNPGCADEDVAVAILGQYARRQDVAPRITNLIDKGVIESSGNVKRNGRSCRTLRAVAHRPQQKPLFPTYATL